MKSLSDKKILESWEKNVSPWAKAIEEKEIESRRLVTDQALVDAVLSRNPNRVLDVGCGEGWLARQLSSSGLSVTGIDAISGLVNRANECMVGDFHVLEYESISSHTFDEMFDLAVCNFSLLGNESVEHLFSVIPAILNDGGHLIIQTIHPHIAGEGASYTDGWREGSWEGFSSEFVDPAPWYFRTLESWVALYVANGLRLQKVVEPVNPKTGKVASLLMIGSIAT